MLNELVFYKWYSNLPGVVVSIFIPFLILDFSLWICSPPIIDPQTIYVYFLNNLFTTLLT